MTNFLRVGSPLSVLAVSFLLPISLGWAHHGWSGYNADIDTTVVVTELRLGSSHDQLVATDSEGQTWDLVLATPQRNRRLGFDENTLSVGDEIDLLGRLHPSRPEIKVHCINMDGRNLYTYRYDNGRTSLARQRKGDDCEAT